MKQIDYIIRGLLLLMVVLIATWTINFLFNIKSSSSTKYDDQPMAAEQTKPVNDLGKKLFSDNCAACHSVNKDLTGPALAGVEKRVTDTQLLYAWIRNNAKVRASGNKYFNELFVRYNKTPMTAFNLTNSEIAAILEYIRQASGPQPVRVLPARIAEVKP